MFWRYGFATTSPVDALLAKPDCTLDQLLDEEELLQEVKSSHTKLTNFLTQPDRIRKLVEYCIVTPGEEANENRVYKLPYIASEVLASGETQISDALSKGESLSFLINFLDAEELDNHLAGYFHKVIVALVEMNPEELLAAIKAKDNLLEGMVRHIKNLSVADLLIKLTTIDELSKGHEIAMHLCESNLIMMLVSALESSDDEEIHANIAEVLMAFAQKHDTLVVGGLPSNIYKNLVSEEVVDKLLTCVLSKSEALLVHGLQIMIVILEKESDPASRNDGAIAELPPIHARIASRLDDFVSLLQRGPDRDFTVSYGQLKPPCGLTRVCVVEFLAQVLRSGYRVTEGELVRLNVVPLCLDLFFQYPWNNFLGAATDALVTSVFEGPCEDVKSSVITKYCLPAKLAQMAARNRGKLAGCRDGNIAFVTQISNTLTKAASGHSGLRTLLDDCNEWKEFLSTDLSELNHKNSIEICGGKPNKKMEVEQKEDDNFNRDEFEMDLNKTAERLRKMKDLDSWREKSYDLEMSDEGQGGEGDDFEFSADFGNNISMNMNPVFDASSPFDAAQTAYDMEAAEDQFNRVAARNIEAELSIGGTSAAAANTELTIDHDSEDTWQPSDEDFAKAIASAVPVFSDGGDAVASGGEPSGVQSGAAVADPAAEGAAWQADFPTDGGPMFNSDDEDL